MPRLRTFLACIILSANLQAGPILHLDFEGDTVNSGSLGSSQNGQSFGTVTFSEDAARGDQSINMGLFTGDHGYVQVPAFTVGDTFTLATWVKADFTAPVPILSRDGMNTVFSTRSSTSSPDGALFFINQWNTQNRAMKLETGAGGRYDGVATPPSSVTNDTWHHVGVSIDRLAEIVQFFVDGEMILSAALAYDNFPDNRPMYIGAPGTTDWWHFDGLIDDFRVYDSILSEQEMEILYMGTQVPEPPLILLYISGLLMLYSFRCRFLRYKGKARLKAYHALTYALSRSVKVSGKICPLGTNRLPTGYPQAHGAPAHSPRP